MAEGQRDMIELREIRRFAERVADQFRPERIILFGSYARGDATDDSDADLLVIMPLECKGTTKAIEIRTKIRAGFPMDLIVRTPEFVQERLRWHDPFTKEILETGKILYESPR